MNLYQTKRFYLNGQPKTGEVIEVNGRKYKLIFCEHYQTLSDPDNFEFTWASNCVECEDVFSFESFREFWPVATCEDCRRSF
jgi:hypothetical protein